MNRLTRLLIVASITLFSVSLASAFLTGAAGAAGPGAAIARLFGSTGSDRADLLVPEITLEKTVGEAVEDCGTTDTITVLPGTEVVYCYEVTNTGDEFLVNHTLVDDQLGTLLEDEFILLSPGGSFLVTTSTVVTDDVTNLATWTAETSLGGSDDAEDSASVTVLDPDFSLSKTANTTPGICPGSDTLFITPGTPVNYCYEITNTGEVTLTQHTLTDSELGSLIPPNSLFDVPPGSSFTFSTTAVITASVVNTGTWTADDGFGNSAQETDTATVEVLIPGINLIKTVSADLGDCPGANTEIVVPGTMVTYCFELFNTGATDLITHTLVDDHLGPILSGQAILIEPGSSHIVSVDALITEEVTNLATWTATDEFANELETTDTANVGITGVELELSKTVGTSLSECSNLSEIFVPPGTTVSYCFRITNTGEITLTTHTLIDSELGLLLDDEEIAVPPGGSHTFTETVVIDASVTNDADWIAMDPFGNPAFDSDSATVNVVAPGILVTPLLLSASLPAGQSTSATLHISNTGTVELTWQANENQIPAGSQPEAGGSLGDTLFELEFGSQLGNNVLLGIEFDGSSFWVTAGGVNDTSEPNLLYEFDRAGSLLNTYTNTVDIPGFGWRDLAFDGAFLYASASGVIDEIDRADGQPTGFTIPLLDTGLTLARAIAYDPATDHFWVANFNSSIYEIGRDGTVINSFPNPGSSIYGLAWDDVSPGGPYLWVWTASNPPKAVQIDPATGLATGVEFTGDSVAGGAGGGGAAITAGLNPDRLVFLGMHQATNDVVIGYDLGVSTGLCAASDLSWLSMDPTSGEIDPGAGVAAEVTFDTTGLSPGLYIGHICITSSDEDTPLVIVKVQLVVLFDFNVYIPVIFRDQ